MGGQRALNRYKFHSKDSRSPGNAVRKFNENLSGPANIQTQQDAPKPLRKLIVLSAEQTKRKSSTLKFIYELPASKEDVLNLINELDSEESVLIALQRIRDLHNPSLITSSLDIEKREKAEKAFDKFALSLLLSFIELTEPVWMHAQKQKNPKVESIALHLQDLIVQGAKQNALGGGSPAILGYIKQQMMGVAELLKSIRD